MTVSRVEVASRERYTLLFVRKNSPGNEETRIQWHDSAESTASSYARNRNKKKKKKEKEKKITEKSLLKESCASFDVHCSSSRGGGLFLREKLGR